MRWDDVASRTCCTGPCGVQRRHAGTIVVTFALVFGCAIAHGAEAGARDERQAFGAGFYFGLGIDSFAAADLNRYLNPGESSQVKERGVGGFDFACRVWKSDGGQAIWLYGETVHGIRSADLDLSGLDSLARFALTGYSDPGSRTLYLIRNATSLEAFVGARIEFMELGGEVAIRPYVFADYGFLTLSGAGGDVLDLSNLGLGLSCVSGRLANSRLEAAIGRSDFFLANHMTRFKVHGVLHWTNGFMDSLSMAMFAEMVVDSDLGPGSDSVQSYLGFEFNLKKFFEPHDKSAAEAKKKGKAEPGT